MNRKEIAEVVENAKRLLQVGGDIGEANAPLAEAAKLLSQTTGPGEVDLALLRLIATVPWLLELAEGGFDPELAEALVVRESFNLDPVKAWRMLKGVVVAPPLPAARCTSVAQAAEDERCEKEAGHHGHHLGRRLAWTQTAVLKEQASDLQTPKRVLDALKEAEKERDALRALLEEIQAIARKVSL